MLRKICAGLLAASALTTVLTPAASKPNEGDNETITMIRKYYFINDSTNQFDTFKSKITFKKIGSIDGISAYKSVKVLGENKAIPHMGLHRKENIDSEYIPAQKEYAKELIINTNTGQAMLATRSSAKTGAPNSNLTTRAELYERKGNKWIGWKVNTDYLNGQAGYTEFYIE